ncbi:MAG TPA: PCYCGC motif-containing (lipo)protein [Candidatus Binataceae bacterium]|nr:PCYCGC motif-containing (lipo)protein [Candidatus Binataceae bacterium]
MFKDLNRETLIAMGAIIVVAICYVGYTSLQSARVPDPMRQLKETLDPNQFDGDVRKAYAGAQHHPGVFSQLKCYGGCGKEAESQSLYDCFTTDYAVKCPVCISEARIATDLAERGVPAESISQVLIQRYTKGK